MHILSRVTHILPAAVTVNVDWNGRIAWRSTSKRSLKLGKRVFPPDTKTFWRKVKKQQEHFLFLFQKHFQKKKFLPI